MSLYFKAPTLWIVIALAASAMGCGSGGGSSSGNASAGGGGTNNPGSPGNPGAQTAFARYELANGCFGIQDTASGNFLAANGADGLAFNGQGLAQATPFFMKASGLGRYLFYDPQQRFMSLASGNEATAGQAGEGGDNVAFAGDLVALTGPNNPAGNGLNDVGDAAGESGGAGANQINANRSFRLTQTPSDGSEWVVDLANPSNAQAFTITSFDTNEGLATITNQGVSDRFRFVETGACAAYPEAQLNATGTPFSGTNPDGTVFGYAETHMHLGGSEALGGRIGYGRPFHRFGITHALGNCEIDHGPNGSTGILDIAVDSNTTIPNHDTVGWPTYHDWPTHSSQTHHQTYYMWLKRAWMGGLRFMVNHLVANELLCLIYPLKENDCNEMDSARLQLQLVKDLQDYIDAQEGGPGRGFFRIVSSAAEARAVIEAGKMAVINGTEMEKVFDCGEFLDSPECSEAQIDASLDEWYDMGLRAIFPLHIFDNAFGGTEISRFTNDPPIITLYNGGNLVETGHPYSTVPCSEAEAIEQGQAPVEDRDLFGLVALQLTGLPPIPGISGCVNNARPLTSRGDYFVNRLVDYGILIETDHSGPLARKRMLDIAGERDVPVLSGHTGSITVSRDSKRILQVGGIISNLSDDPAPVTIQFIQDLEQAYIEVFGNTDGLATGFGSDINGIHAQSEPRDDAATNPLPYPFTSYGGNVVFERQVTGERTFDLNTDGVAHYGLYPDYIADIQRTPGGPQALKYLFRSAEAYIQAMERAEAARTRP